MPRPFPRFVLARPALFLLLGCLVGAVVTAPAASAFRGATKQITATQTRTFSCPGLDFQPLSSDNHSFNNGLLRSAEDTGYFICNAVLPTRAVGRGRIVSGDLGQMTAQTDPYVSRLSPSRFMTIRSITSSSTAP